MRRSQHRRPGLLIMLLRGLTLRCPNCGAWGVFKSYGVLRDHCPRCGVRLDRGEGGAGMVLNLFVSEMLFAAAFVLTLILTWPNVPWNFLQWGSVAGMVIAPFLFYPFSRTLWLAIDLNFRPAEPDDFRRPSADPRP